MLFRIWFIIPTLVCHDVFAFEYTKPSIYFPKTSVTQPTNQNIRHYDIVVRNGSSTKVLRPFWKSTGLCPPDPHEEAFKFLLSSDMKQNLFHIGSLPFKGITQIRIHWLLDLVTMRIKSDFSVAYNFTYLDELISDLQKNNLYLGFELMGNPSNYFTDFENVTQVYMWRDLIKDTATHLIGLYGIDYVKHWNFETWNEPDHHDFDSLNITIQGFLNYYDACSEGLKDADKSLKFGGPGGSCRIPGKGHSPICWALIEHCIRGKNYFTGKTGIRLDFLSFHKKGNASTLEILREELETIDLMRKKKISKNIPFYNDEADPMKNWAHPEEWRADVSYAAMVVKIILSHIEFYFMKNQFSDLHFGLLSNDNAFLSYFPNQFLQRTLLARFQVNNTSPKYVDFIKKPVYTIFGLLSQLCSNILHSKFKDGGNQVKNMNDFGFLATHCPSKRNQIVLLMYNSVDTFSSNVTFDINITISLPSLTLKYARWVAFEVNNDVTNPYLVWKKFGMPVYPTDKEFLLMKDKEEPHLNGPFNLKDFSPIKLHLQLLNPGVTLVNICTTRPLLNKVEQVRFLQIRNNSLYISWTDRYNRCVFTYNIEYSINASGPYTKINKKQIAFASFFYSCSINDINCSISGFYRIYAVDYWFIKGPSSVPIKYLQVNN